MSWEKWNDGTMEMMEQWKVDEFSFLIFTELL